MKYLKYSYLFLTILPITLLSQGNRNLSQNQAEFIHNYAINDLFSICDGMLFFDPLFHKKIDLKKSNLFIAQNQRPVIDSVNKAYINYFKGNAEAVFLQYSLAKLNLSTQANLKFTSKKINQMRSILEKEIGYINFSTILKVQDNYILILELYTINDLGTNYTMLGYTFKQSSINGLVIPMDRRMFYIVSDVSAPPYVRIVDTSNPVVTPKPKTDDNTLSSEYDYKAFNAVCPENFKF
jgi:hypothetical protein